ncbi:hypothetical protein D3C80_1147740 [compost metagenome]
MARGPGQHAEHHQQAEQGGVVAAQQLALLFGAIAAVHAERVAGRAQRHGGGRSRGGHAFVDDTVLAHPVVADANLQRIVRADQAQGREQVVAIHGADRPVVALAGPVHQQRMARRHRVAIHQPERAVGVLARVDDLIELPEQR